MLLVQAVYNVQTQLALVPAILVIKKPNVILFVVVIQLDQAAQHVISPQVNVHAMRDTQEPHVASVTLTTIERAMELAEVRNNQFTKDAFRFEYKIHVFSACGCDATSSSDLQCADSTGQCTCIAGYKGTKCDTACGCDTTGLGSTICDQVTGQCPCSTGYTGTICNSCDANYYRASDGTCKGRYHFSKAHS